MDFFHNQDEMFDAHRLLGNMFVESSAKLEGFFDTIHHEFVVPIERFLAHESKECKLLKRKMDEREEKYFKYLRK